VTGHALNPVGAPSPLAPAAACTGGSHRARAAGILLRIMLRFSQDPRIAEQQMHAVIFYLTTFGYIDGDFDDAEKGFVRDYLRRLVASRVEAAVRDGDPRVKAEMVEKWTRHFHEVFEGIDRTVKDLFTEAVAEGEDQNAFVHAKLKQRCFEIFRSFGREGQDALLESIDELLMADGTAHPAEVKFRAELSALLETALDVELVDDDGEPSTVTIGEPTRMLPAEDTHPFFDQFEYHYSRDPERIRKQVEADLALVERAIRLYDAQRADGKGKLSGKTVVKQLAGERPFLDGHVHVLPPTHPAGYELTVLGDLHGCYSCLKGALMQSRFFEKVEAFRRDPAAHPDPKLVLLGDYIDRGMFSLNGVLRTVLQLVCTAPDHVYALRGNHEYYVEFKGNVYGGVKPAESINTLKPHLPVDVFRRYIRLFEAMPNVLLFDRIMFVHGGIPRDRVAKEKVRDLAGLNDPDVRFQMMWSDPSTADVIPAELQEQSARFAFGKLQAQAFLHRLGLDALVRGHEKVDGGFRVDYDEPGLKLVTLFSAGGATNDDLPLDSSYRSVTPMALTVTWKDGVTRFTPWEIDYEPWNDPQRNAFFRVPPELPLVKG
jgi:hypothetical protein